MNCPKIGRPLQISWYDFSLEDKTLDRIFAERIFGPLGMSNTALPNPNVTTVPDPSSHGYQYGPLQVSDKAIEPEETAAARAGTLAPMM